MAQHHLPVDQMSISTEASFSTTHSSGPSSQQLSALRSLLKRAGRLPNELWSPSKSGNDYSSLAEILTRLSYTISQLVPVLNRDTTISSAEAWRDVVDMAQQCNFAFDFIEQNIVTAGREQWQSENVAVKSPGTGTATVTTKEVECLSALFAGICSTFGVMMQVFELAQKIVESKYPRTPEDNDAIDVMKQMVQNLVIQQQFCLLKASKLVRQFQLQASSPPLVRQRTFSSGSPTDTGYFGTSPSSATLSLAKFQERNMLPSLFPSFSMSSAAYFSSAATAEKESMALINRMASTRVDELLYKWTNVHNAVAVEDDFDHDAVKGLTGSMNMMNFGPPRRRLTYSSPMSHEDRLRRLSQQPSVESDEEESDDIKHLRDYRLGGPILAVVGEDQKLEDLPSPRTYHSIPVHPGRAPEMSRTFSTPSYVPSSPSSTFRRPSASSSSSSKPQQHWYSSSLPSSAQNFQQRHRQETESVTSSSGRSSNGNEIVWYLRFDSSKWDFRDDIMVKSNTQLPWDEALRNSYAYTEIREECIDFQALEETGLEYRIVPEEVRSGKKSKRKMVRIKRPMHWKEVEAISNHNKDTKDMMNDWDNNRKPEKRGSLSISPAWAPTERDLREKLKEKMGETLKEEYGQTGPNMRDGGKKDRRRSSNNGYDRPKLERRHSTMQRRESMRDERDYRDYKERKDREKSRDRRYVEDEEDDEYLTDKTPRARSRSRRRNERYDDYDNKDRPTGGGRRGSFMEAAIHAGRVMAPAAGVATLVIKGLSAM